MKRFISLLLVLAMICGLGIVTSAVEEPFSLVASVEKPVVNEAYTVNIVINTDGVPGGLSVKFSELKNCTVTGTKKSWNGDVLDYSNWDQNELVGVAMNDETIPSGSTIFTFTVTPSSDNSSFKVNVRLKDKTAEGDNFVFNEDYVLSWTVPCDEHTWGAWSSIDVNNHSRTCSVCEETETEAHDMQFSSYSVEPSCGVPGVAVYVCSVCGYTEYRNVNALTHSYVIVGDKTADTHQLICEHCQTDYIVEAHQFGEPVTTPADCVNPGDIVKTCAVCGYEAHTPIPVTSHNYVGVVTTAPTCTTAGVMTYTCSGCGDSYEETILPLNHDFEEEFTVDVPATCTSVGSKSRHCTRCTEVTDVTEIPLEAHNYVGTVTTKATCTEDGVMTYTCTVCKDSYDDVILALNHDFSDEYTIDVPSTCTVAGSKSRHCSRCTEVTDVTPLPLADHEYGEWEVITPASCKAPGLKKHFCANCTAYEEDTIPVLPHTYDTYKYVDADSHKKICSECNDEVTEAHVEGKWVEVTPATYKTKGLKELHCALCDGVIRTEDIDILECPHANTEIRNAVKASCTEAGYTGDTYCLDCEKIVAEGSPIEPLSHNYVWKPDYSDTQHAKVCANCDDVIEVGDHVYGDVWEIITEPAADANGQAHKVCECGHEITIEVVLKNYKEATYTEEGYTGDYVIVDGENEVVLREGSVIEKIAHEHKPVVINAKDATTEEDGYTGDTVCEYCGEMIAEGRVIPKIVTGDDNPQTGDAPMTAYIFAMIVSLGALSVMTRTAFKRRKED